jgi:ABC-type branched-subunit amino acid transport system substrate-binding protein
LDIRLPENGFELVYKGVFPMSSLDFSSYFAAAEAAGVEVLLPIIASDSGIPFVKEYYDRQSPLFVQGLISTASLPESWMLTDGKCEHMIVTAQEIVAGYPLTSTTLPTRDAYLDRWGESIRSGLAYDIMRFILPDALERAGTIETEVVIEALEKTSIETSTVENFVFTKSHCSLTGENANNPDASYRLSMLFQWQNGEMVPVYPQRIMEEAGAYYTFPDWPGPWDDLD